MFYDKSSEQLNNLERVQGGAIFTLGHKASVGQRLGDDLLYNDGDLISIGSIPRDSVCTDIRILVQEAFPAGVTIDYGFASFTGDEITGIVAIATDIVVETIDHQIVVPMPVSGNFDTAGVAYTGDRGGIWTETGDVPMVVVINSAGAVDSGKLTILNSFTYFGTKAGGYIK